MTKNTPILHDTTRFDTIQYNEVQCHGEICVGLRVTVKDNFDYKLKTIPNAVQNLVQPKQITHTAHKPMVKHHKTIALSL